MWWLFSGLFAGSVGWKRLGLLDWVGLKTLLLPVSLNFCKQRVSLALRHPAKLHRWGRRENIIKKKITKKMELIILYHPSIHSSILLSILSYHRGSFPEQHIFWDGQLWQRLRLARSIGQLLCLEQEYCTLEDWLLRKKSL